MNPALTRPTRLARLSAAIVRGRRLPFSVTFILTDRCNFRCDYCNIPTDPAEEMTRPEFERAIDELADAGMARASFSGGEALLRPDAIDIIAHAHRRQLYTSLNTNGWLAVEQFDRLAGVLDMMVVSLDGDAAVHDRIARRKGSHERVVQVLSKARTAGLTTATITVLGPWNLHLVPQVLDTARQLGAWAYFQPAQDDCYDADAGLSHGLGSVELNRIADDLAAGMRAGLPVAASPGYLTRLRRGPKFTDCGTCAAGRYFATVLPDGRMVPCHLTSEQREWPSGRTTGFAKAFAAMGDHKSGNGCAISPYQESDLIFSRDPRAVVAAFKRMRRPA
ncbi:MAG: MoaA/NifB/PqqE/SkfB family radical SAM enzyme [Myxococcota bacterium]|jgi:MoaA/NifB/PqqE/SkfB family radical SAM enzyme